MIIEPINALSGMFVILSEFTGRLKVLVSSWISLLVTPRSTTPGAAGNMLFSQVMVPAYELLPARSRIEKANSFFIRMRPPGD